MIAAENSADSTTGAKQERNDEDNDDNTEENNHEQNENDDESNNDKNNRQKNGEGQIKTENDNGKKSDRPGGGNPRWTL